MDSSDLIVSYSILFLCRIRHLAGSDLNRRRRASLRPVVVLLRLIRVRSLRVLFLSKPTTACFRHTKSIRVNKKKEQKTVASAPISRRLSSYLIHAFDYRVLVCQAPPMTTVQLIRSFMMLCRISIEIQTSHPVVFHLCLPVPNLCCFSLQKKLDNKAIPDFKSDAFLHWSLITANKPRAMPQLFRPLDVVTFLPPDGVTKDMTLADEVGLAPVCGRRWMKMAFGSQLVRGIATSASLHGKRNFRKFPLYNKRGSREFKARQAKNPDPDVPIHRECCRCECSRVPLQS